MAHRHGGWVTEKEFDNSEQCWSCRSKFTFFARRHHCRYCKHSFCQACSPFMTTIPDMRVKEAVRVCGPCRDAILGTRTCEWPDNGHEEGYDYDLFVIGGGSGGLACAKEAAKLQRKVGLCDFVTPSPQNTSWGLGGTCVNVGCIPKKLMHHASLLGENSRDLPFFGWESKNSHDSHSWERLVEAVQNHIRSLNTGYETQLQGLGIDYHNAMGKMKNAHTINLSFADGTDRTVTARRIVIAVGGRPKQLNVPGGEYCITSDDIFSMRKSPGKEVLVVGASYVALECAGFLTGMGYSVTVMARSVLLRGFDQEVAEKIGSYMESTGTKIIRGKQPQRITKGQDGRLSVTFGEDVKLDDSSSSSSSASPSNTLEVDTVLVAVGRDVCTPKLGLCCAGVMRLVNGKIPIFNEQTNIPNIYAIGDVAALEGSLALELTPVAIQAGKLLAQRLYGGSSKTMDYCFVPTTIFTPLEYGCIGLTEADAREMYGDDRVEVFHQVFQPLEMSLSGRMNRPHNSCFCKLVIDKEEGNRVVGFHYLGPNAGEVTQGFAVAMRKGATKEDFDSTIGIHPTCAENLTTLEISKGSGLSAVKEDC